MEALLPLGADFVLLARTGEVARHPVASAHRQLAARPVLVCHARLTATRLGIEKLVALDVLELFAFVRPGQFCVPTVRGLAETLGLPQREGESAALTLFEAADLLLDELSTTPAPHEVASIAEAMRQGGWGWGEAVLNALATPPHTSKPREALAVPRKLPEWEEATPPTPNTEYGISDAAARSRLATLVAAKRHGEPRPEQSDYASAVATAFSPPPDEHPTLVLAEAGTGVGKTLGYLAPASLWAEANEMPVWVSTYTRNLQRQIEGEARRIYPGESGKVVVRKGRENYLCLLNYEEAVNSTVASPALSVALGLVARWLAVTEDGDLRGGDFPGWLSELLGRNRILSLADRRGECLFGACAHYKKCFIEHSQRRTVGAQVVIANHALVMHALASGGVDEANAPSRFVFDEGHHLFQAADEVFGIDLSGHETADLRRWLLGGEGRRKGRVRGLAKRAEAVLPATEEAALQLEEALQRALVLPGEQWAARLKDGNPHGPTEQFLAEVRALVVARDKSSHSAYARETPVSEIPDSLLLAANRLAEGLAGLEKALRALQKTLEKRLDDEAGSLEAETRQRIVALSRTLESYALMNLSGWQAALTFQTAPDFFDWFELEEGYDVALKRRWHDPMKPFAQSLLPQAAGVVVTSATLTDSGRDAEARWQAAEADSGAAHLTPRPLRAIVPSPFDYAQQTRVLVVDDVDRQDIVALVAAYRELFLAAKGGALGLFTAIDRLKKVQHALTAPLAAAGLPLYAQHVDGLEPTTLIDIFRAEGNACLLGTDAVRDGVDVPGQALQLLVFERIPWPRTDLLLKARKERLGGAAYIERLTRQRLRQAFGRLIRRATDRGVFVLLQPLPSKLALAFPEGVMIERVGLAEAVAATRAFLHEEKILSVTA